MTPTAAPPAAAPQAQEGVLIDLDDEPTPAPPGGGGAIPDWALSSLSLAPTPGPGPVEPGHANGSVPAPGAQGTGLQPNPAAHLGPGNDLPGGGPLPAFSAQAPRLSPPPGQAAVGPLQGSQPRPEGPSPG